MREIKFRAWDKRKKVMREVAVLQFNRITKEVSGIEYWTEDLSLKSLHVNYINVMQYTGLKDKNGVEIYEGDIVRHSRVASDISIVKVGEFGVPNIEEMAYQDNAIGFYYENASDLKDMAPFNMTIPLNNEYVRRDEVIGNIYENKELLNG